MLYGDRRDLSKHDSDDSLAEDSQSEALAAEEEWEEFDGHDPHHGVEENRVAEGVDEDECDGCTRPGRILVRAGNSADSAMMMLIIMQRKDDPIPGRYVKLEYT